VLIIVAQLIVAGQFVLEERLISSMDVPPLLAVGLEGAFGFVTLSAVLVGMYFLPGVTGLSEVPARLEDPIDALKQVVSGNWTLTLAMIAAVLSIAFYNFFGISVTKQLSAAHRMVMDCTRTVIVWGFSMTVYYADLPVGPRDWGSSSHGQKFSALQLVGFLILIMGSLVYYDIHKVIGRGICPGLMAKWEKKWTSTLHADDPLLSSVNNVEAGRVARSDEVRAS